MAVSPALVSARLMWGAAGFEIGFFILPPMPETYAPIRRSATWRRGASHFTKASAHRGAGGVRWAVQCNDFAVGA